MLLPVDVLEVDVLVVDDLELDVLGARHKNYMYTICIRILDSVSFCRPLCTNPACLVPTLLHLLFVAKKNYLLTI